jgi:hypothetical protein
MRQTIKSMGWNRRDFLKTASAATLSALAASFPRQLLADESNGEPKIKPTADTVIVLWMGGGMAHTETFDPKGHTPFTKGMSPSELFSTFPSIATAVDHIKFTEGVEKLAAVMDRGTLIRSYTAGDPWVHPSFPASISVAHRVCPAANGRCATPWLGHCTDVGFFESSRPRFH